MAIEEMNPGYCELKALELIKEARLAANDISQEAEKKVLEAYNEKMARAISLMAYARALRNGPVQGKTKQGA